MITPEEFKADVRVWAEEIGVEPVEIHIRKMKRKWASCSSRGRLTFDTSLLNESEGARSRTILHELLHLKYPNHGRMFNILLNTYLRNGTEEYRNDRDPKDC
jgi:predicted metal-dependent hydrolase